MPVPDRDFDVTEVAVPWHILRSAGHEVAFASERAGTVPRADPRLLAGGLFGKLGAEPEAKGWYAGLQTDQALIATAAWTDRDLAAFDGLLLTGRHSRL